MIDKMQEKTRLAKIRRKELEAKKIATLNLEVARREIKMVSSQDDMKKLYGRVEAGGWEKKDDWVSSVDVNNKTAREKDVEEEDRRAGRKPTKAKKEKGGVGKRSEAKSRWEFHEVSTRIMNGHGKYSCGERERERERE